MADGPTRCSASSTTWWPRAAEVDSTGKFPGEAVARPRAGGHPRADASTPDVGGGGQGLRAAADVVRRLAASVRVDRDGHADALRGHRGASRSTGPRTVRRRDRRPGEHLSTLAFSEAGSRSHFWAPLGTATATGDAVRLDARKSWVTSAGAGRQLRVVEPAARRRRAR